MRRTFAVVRLAALGVIALLLWTMPGHAKPAYQSALVRFDRPTWVVDTMLTGTYLVEHDDRRMRRGLPCTTIYRVRPGGRGMDEVVAFMCIPHERDAVRRFTTTVIEDPITGMDMLSEYQFAGDTEGHGVPVLALVRAVPVPCPGVDAVETRVR